MSTSTTKSTTGLLKKVFHREPKPMTEAEYAQAERIRKEKANFTAAAATYLSLR